MKSFFLSIEYPFSPNSFLVGKHSSLSSQFETPFERLIASNPTAAQATVAAKEIG
ncbi:MAG: hypothetical protein IPP35_09385 [Elusimicrobia bacterium]|nr:hypothetical protein [Elusimicrobiota bacterium]